MANTLVWTLVAGLGYILGSCVVWFKRDWSSSNLSVLLAISTGLLLSVSIGGMIPHGLSESFSLAPWILVGMLVAFGFQRWKTKRSSGSEKTTVDDKGIAWSTLSSMGIHAYFEGFAIGTGFHVDPQFGIAVLFALVLHKIPEGVAISTLILVGYQERKKAIGSTAVLGILTLLGAGTALWMTDLSQLQSSSSAIAILFSAGILLYVAGAELLPIVRQSGNRQSVLFVLSGVIVYYALGWASMFIAPVHLHAYHDSSAAMVNSHSSHDRSHHHTMQPVDIPEGMPVPTVQLEVYEDSESGWNIHVQTTHFRFAPEHVNGSIQMGEGHAHLYLNDQKIARLYGSWYHLNALSPGRYEIRVELNTNQHAPYAYKGKKIEASKMIVVK